MLGAQTWSRNQDAYGTRARLRIDMDARNSTEYGLLRTFVRLEATNNTGTYTYVQGNGPHYINRQGGAAGSNAGVAMSVDRAFVQLGGLTAGRTQSFFDFYADTLNWGGVIRGSDLINTVLAYTATFGSGFSATLSLEDGMQRMTNIDGIGAADGNGYSGSRMPDIVANVRIDQNWGSAQLSGALHQVNASTAQYAAAGWEPGSSAMGWALQAGVRVNLPMLAAGDQIWLQAAYAQGAISYLGYGGAGNGSTWTSNATTGLVGVGNSDALINPVTGSLELTSGFAITAAFLHFWTPTIRQALFGSYAALDYAGGVSPVGGVAVNRGSFGVDNSQVAVGTNLIWSPIRGLDIGGEVIWMQTHAGNPIISPKNADVANTTNDGWMYRLRIQRDF